MKEAEKLFKCNAVLTLRMMKQSLFENGSARKNAARDKLFHSLGLDRFLSRYTTCSSGKVMKQC